jgi:hypothetical protein
MSSDRTPLTPRRRRGGASQERREQPHHQGDRFLKAYMKLGVDEQKIYCRSIWYNNQNARQRVLRLESDVYENWPFRGLYWLSKDLFELGFRDVTQPDADALYEIRNRIEHSYLKVHEIMAPVSRRGRTSRDLWTDRLAYSIQRQDLEEKTLRVFKLARAALIYLSLGMHREELSRRAAREQQAQAAGDRKPLNLPMQLPLWDDNLKR